LKTPREHRDVAVQTCRHHLTLHRYDELRPATVLKLIEAFDGLRRPERLRVFALACEADKRGRIELPADMDYPQGAQLLADLAAVRAVSSESLRARGLQGPAFGAALRELRVKALLRLRAQG
jgi:tRNA nucleotidyltransferase (CCA-adding enzyme)